MGFVYFLRKEGKSVFKIGATNKSPYSRLVQIQTNTPDKLIIYGAIRSANPFRLEKELHRKYHAHRIKGEWFNLEEQEIKSLLASHPDTYTPEWIELEQGHRTFLYRISTDELYFTLDSLGKVSQFYLCSLLSTDCLIMPSVGALIRFDILIEDWPEFAEDLRAQKELVLITAREFLKGESGYDPLGC